ncbi:MAG: universal stress protein [Sandaracinaceae bacterium]
MAFATHILVPTDFSEASRLAIRAARMLAERLGARITLLHVHDPDALRPPAHVAMSPDRQHDLDAEVRAAGERRLDEIRDEVAKSVKRVDTEVVDHPSAANAIVEQAEELGADLVVIATHGRTGLKHLLIGSVAERVVRHCSVPVLTLRSHAED